MGFQVTPSRLSATSRRVNWSSCLPSRWDSIRLDIQTGDKLGSGKVSVGRYITQDIFLSYERQLGDEKGNKVGVEYSINRHLKVKGSSSNTGDSALDILWRIDY